MSSERVKARVERLLDDADVAIGNREWKELREICQVVLRLDPDNYDAAEYLKLASESVGELPPSDGSTADLDFDLPSQSASSERPNRPPSFTSDIGGWIHDRAVENSRRREQGLAPLRGVHPSQAAGGLRAPQDVVAATNAYRDESDVLTDFISDECFLETDAFTPSKAITTAYADYVKRTNGRRLTQRELGDRLGRRGFINGTARIAGKTVRGWHGVGVDHQRM